MVQLSSKLVSLAPSILPVIITL